MNVSHQFYDPEVATNQWERRLEAAVDYWIKKRYSHVTLAGGVYNMHTPEGPPALRAQLKEDFRGMLEGLRGS